MDARTARFVNPLSFSAAAAAAATALSGARRTVACATALSALAVLAPHTAQADLLNLKNKAPLEKVLDADLPRETFVMTFMGGNGTIPKGKQGLGTIYSMLFEEGPKGMDPDEFRKKLFLLTADVSLSGDARAMNLVITAPPDTFLEALSLAERTLKDLKLDEETFARVKARALSGREAATNQMSYMNRYFGFRDSLNYQPDTLTGDGAVKTVKSLTVKDARDNMPRLFSRARAFYTSIGPVPVDNVRKEVEKVFVEGEPKADFQPFAFKDAVPPASRSKTIAVTILNKKGATDNQVLYVFPYKVKRGTPEAFDSSIAQEILGGGLTGRLGKTLRVERGLTYGVGSFASTSLPIWGVSTFGGIFQTKDLVSGVLEVVGKFKREPISKDDVSEAKEAAITDFLSDTELPSDRLFAKIRYRLYGLPLDYLDTYLANLGQVDGARVASYVKTRIPTEGGHLYMMGDKDKLVPMFAKLGKGFGKPRVVEIGAVQ